MRAWRVVLLTFGLVAASGAVYSGAWSDMQSDLADDLEGTGAGTNGAAIDTDSIRATAAWLIPAATFAGLAGLAAFGAAAFPRIWTACVAVGIWALFRACVAVAQLFVANAFNQEPAIVTMHSLRLAGAVLIVAGAVLVALGKRRAAAGVGLVAGTAWLAAAMTAPVADWPDLYTTSYFFGAFALLALSLWLLGVARSVLLWATSLLFALWSLFEGLATFIADEPHERVKRASGSLEVFAVGLIIYGVASFLWAAAWLTPLAGAVRMTPQPAEA